MPTLLPYIKSINNPFPIKLSFVQKTDQQRFPFVVISESGTFTRILKAEIASDHGSTIAPVFLLMGKDQYLLTGREQDILDNRDVDQLWQSAYRHFSKDHRFITLSEQTGQDSGIRQFRSLFFCSEKEVFFHPVCPECGKTLELCTDDALLNSFGLAPYTKTLRRFLYCSDCLRNKQAAPFYTHAPDTSDTEIVKDLHHLIDGFGSLKQGLEDGLPCMGCPLYDECYNGSGLAHERIVAFSFYPFHLLVLKSASITASDFLALISGATLADIKAGMSEKSQPGRLPFVESVSRDAANTSPLLFETDARYFLELLYLKLSFLGQLARIVISDIDSYRYPGLDLSLDRIWVDLSGEKSLLPFFWNFQARLIDLDQCTIPNAYFPKMPPSYGSYLLSMAWFHTLLSNAIHTPADINTAVAKSIVLTDPLVPEVDEDLVLQEYSHLFSPGNIFWNPLKTEPAKEWYTLWEDALGLGWTLLKNTVPGNIRISGDDFWQSFEQLRLKIRDHLFMSAAKISVQTEDLSHDSSIQAILAKIIDQWSASDQSGTEEKEETLITQEHLAENTSTGKLEETVIMNSAPRPPGQYSSFRQEEDVVETVILSAWDVPAVQAPEIADEIPETVIIKQDEKIPLKTGSPIKDNDPGDMGNNLESTVIMKEGGGDETIIMKKDSVGRQRESTSQKSTAKDNLSDEDPLEETVIIRSDKDLE
ncbi:MAG TPA: hypothetical protein ENN05_03040 [Deltaproteobacteria bacterium]|nr:hypothetical protein [Deltaproteobacteria bacterium]